MTRWFTHIEKKRVFSHLIFWLFWITGFTFIQGFGGSVSGYWTWLVYYLVTLPIFVTHTYLIAYWLVPHYFFNRRYFHFSGYIVLFLVFFSIVELVVSNELVWQLVSPENRAESGYLNITNILINGIGNAYIVVVFLAIKIARIWNEKIVEQAELMNQKLSTEIELLHYQSYPKFVLSVVDKLEILASGHSVQTPEMIVKLSNLMTNMTTGRKATKIPLKKEIELIRDYVDVQRTTSESSLRVNIFQSGEPGGVEIPQFLLFQLVEEGFICVGDPSDETDFTILIKTEPHYLLFSLTLWSETSLAKPFNQAVTESCRKFLSYFYSENHKVMSNFEVNFVEIIIELYL